MLLTKINILGGVAVAQEVIHHHWKSKNNEYRLKWDFEMTYDMMY